MKKLLLLALLSLAGCRAPTPAEHVRNLRIEVKVVKAGCAYYLLRADYPRDPELDDVCPKLIYKRPP